MKNSCQEYFKFIEQSIELKFALFNIVFTCCSILASAQTFPDISFTRLTEKNGLSNDDVTFVTQDDEGFIWVATHDGLNRLDGYQIKKFYHHPSNIHSLVNNDIVKVVRVSQNKIGVITLEGTCYYDKVKNFFISLSNNRQNSELKSSSSGIPLIGPFYFFKDWLDRHHDTIMFQSKPIGLKDFRFSYDHLYRDRKNKVWAFGNEWILLLDSTMRQVRNLYKKSSLGIISMYQDSYLNYWIGTFGGGLFEFRPGNKIPFQPVPVAPGATIVNSISEWKDKENRRWIVTGTNKGLVLINPLNFRNKTFLPEKDNEFSIPGSGVNCVYVDRQNILWVGTNSGLGYVEPAKQLITSWSIALPGEERNPSVTGTDREQAGFYSSFYNDSDCYWSSNFIKPGLIKYNDEGKMEMYLKNLCPACSPEIQHYTSQAFSIYRQQNGMYWFSTNAGLAQYEPVTRKLFFYRPVDAHRETGFRTIIPYNDSLLWIRTRNNAPYGIYVFNTNQKKFIRHYHYADGCNNCLPPDLMDMLITKNKHIYTTPVNHFLYTYNSSIDNFVRVKPNNKDSIIFPASTFESLAEDQSGNLWIGTMNGLFLFDPVQNKILKDFSADKELGGVEISALCFDEDQNLWMNTERGLYCLVHQTGKIYNFNTGDGLPGNSLPGFLAKGKNGYLLAGSWGYVIHFKPSELLHHSSSGKVHFSDAMIMNKSCSWEYGKDNLRTLTLLPGQNNFSVDFAVLNFDGAASNRYFYKLDGLSNEWKENENGHLTFYDLPPGNYLLHVKGGDKYGEIFKEEDLLAVLVKPLWWQTTSFRIGCFAAFGLLVFMILRRRIQNIRRQAAFKQKIAETEMMALRTQMNPHFIFNSLNGIEYFILRNDTRHASAYLNKFASLIRIILSNSRKDLVPFSEDLQTIGIYVDLELLRFNHNFRYVTDIDKTLLDLDYRVPPLLIQPFVENAIIHGFAHSDKKDLTLKITAKPEGDYIVYLIEDNGVGRKESSVYNNLNKPNHVSMGVQITQQRIGIFNEQHNAKSMMNIEDLLDEANQPAGTRITVKIKTI